MAGNFFNRWLSPCFEGVLNNPYGIGNMCGSLFRWMNPSNVGKELNRETSIQGSSGDWFSQYYWHKSLAHHLYGMFSMAVAQANVENEDCSQLVSGSLIDGYHGPRGVFVGIYDGHGGATCSQFVLEHLFNNFKSAIANQNGVVNAEVFREAYDSTEQMSVNHVRTSWHNKPQLAVLGSCCLVGVLFNNFLYVANAGDSRAVLASWAIDAGLDEVEVIQLSVDYNVEHIARRDEVSTEHPGTNLFPEDNGCFLLRGSLHVTRAIGHVYLKHNEFNEAPLPTQYIQEEPIVRPILKAEPTIRTHQLGPDDKFVIFASRGFWNEINNEEAVSFVRNFTRNGAAAMLMRKALERAASKHGRGYYDLRYFNPGAKRRYHDDISVIIIFFNIMMEPCSFVTLFGAIRSSSACGI